MCFIWNLNLKTETEIWIWNRNLISDSEIWELTLKSEVCIWNLHLKSESQIWIWKRILSSKVKSESEIWIWNPNLKSKLESGSEIWIWNLKCESEIIGIILKNDHPSQSGLQFTQDKLKYILYEHPGTIFSMSNNARYHWKHGLPPVNYERISVTCRIFKKNLL